jgi:TolB-like protein
VKIQKLFLYLAPAFLGGGVCGAELFPPNAFSDSARGVTSASFLKSPASARLAALGSGGGAVRGPDAFFCNPAGTAYLPRGSSALLLGYDTLLEGSGRTAFAGLTGLKNGALGIGALYRYETGLKKYDDFGNEAGGLEAYDAAFIGSYGRRFGWGAAGLAVKYLRSKLYDRSAGSAALDLGALIKDGGNGAAEFALFARNFGLPLKLGSAAGPLPFELGGALSFRYTRQFSLLIDGRAPVDHSPYLILAGEYGFPSAAGLCLRAGLNFKNYGDLGLMGAFTGGFGVKLGAAGLDYAFAPYGDLGVTHRLTLGWGFGPEKSGPADAGTAGPLSSAARGPEKLSAAVATFDALGGTTDMEARQFSDMLEAELLKAGGFSLVERTKLDFILAEKKLISSGLKEPERSGELAKLVGAGAVLYGSVSKEKKGYLIAVKLADARTGEILAAESRNAEDIYFFKQTARDLAERLSAY